jgi:hypothetical protein
VLLELEGRLRKSREQASDRPCQSDGHLLVILGFTGVEDVRRRYYGEPIFGSSSMSTPSSR